METRIAALRAARRCANRYRRAAQQPTPLQPGDVVRVGPEFWAIRAVTPAGLLAWSFSIDARWPPTTPRAVRRAWICLPRLHLVPHRP